MGGCLTFCPACESSLWTGWWTTEAPQWGRYRERVVCILAVGFPTSHWSEGVWWALGDHSLWGHAAWPVRSQGIISTAYWSVSDVSRAGICGQQARAGSTKQTGGCLAPCRTQIVFLCQHWLWTAPAFTQSLEKPQRADLLPPGFPACCIKCKV